VQYAELERSTARGKKVVVITSGQPTLMFKTALEAQKCKDNGIVIDFIVVNSAFQPGSGDAFAPPQSASWDGFQHMPSYPWRVHTHHINGLQELQMGMHKLVSRFLPRICPEAVSMRRKISQWNRQGYALVHLGRDCGNWWHNLGRHRTPRGCARRAARDGFKSFVFQFSRVLRRKGKYQCWSHKKFGKMEAVEKNNVFQAKENTCTCTNRYCTGRAKGGQKGWDNQVQKLETGYSHYMVVDKFWKKKAKKQRKFVTRAKNFVKKFSSFLKGLFGKKFLQQNKPDGFLAIDNSDDTVLESATEIEQDQQEMVENMLESDAETGDATTQDEVDEMLKESEERRMNR